MEVVMIFGVCIISSAAGAIIACVGCSGVAACMLCGHYICECLC